MSGARAGRPARRDAADAEPNPAAAAIVKWVERSGGRGCRVVRIEPLPPSSTRRHLIEVVLPDGSIRSLLLRRFHDAGRLAADPWYAPADEVRALELLALTSVPAPRLVAADLEASECDVPALLVSWLPGRTRRPPEDMDAFLARTAEALVTIHAVRVAAATGLRPHAPYHEPGAAGPPPVGVRRRLWERVASVLSGPHPSCRGSFIHRDFHPGNLLWSGTAVTGVVDWTTAAWGPPGIDLARMRMSLAMQAGAEAADGFAAAYTRAGGDPSARHPYWDLLDAADLLPDLDPVASSADGLLERLEDHVERVLAEY